MMKRLNEARLFAIEKHGDQLYAGKPYIFHLTQVVNVLEEFGYTDKNLLVAGYLHDTLEDTNTSVYDLAYGFNFDVYYLVEAVTGRGINRAERTADTIKKLEVRQPAIPLKMADRLANMRFSSKNSQKHIDMYIKELPKYGHLFYGPMYDEMLTFKESYESIKFYSLHTKPVTGEYDIS